MVSCVLMHIYCSLRICLGLSLKKLVGKLSQTAHLMQCIWVDLKSVNAVVVEAFTMDVVTHESNLLPRCSVSAATCFVLQRPRRERSACSNTSAEPSLPNPAHPPPMVYTAGQERSKGVLCLVRFGSGDACMLR